MTDEIFNTRVLKAHIDAAEESLEMARAILAAGGTRREAAMVIAEAVVTANDKKTRYVVVVRDSPHLWVFGPYASFGSALKAAKSGWLNPRNVPLTGRVLPLISAPKKNVKKLTIPKEEEISE